MSYAVYVQRFANGERAYAPFGHVTSILEKYGRLALLEDRGEFIPASEDICDVGYLGGSEATGTDGVGFDRPVSSERMRALVFELLGVDGMCYFEQDVRYVLARSDVTETLPEGLLELCESGRCTVISSAEEIPL
jgi:hypothetical protein